MKNETNPLDGCLKDINGQVAKTEKPFKKERLF